MFVLKLKANVSDLKVNVCTPMAHKHKKNENISLFYNLIN